MVTSYKLHQKGVGGIHSPGRVSILGYIFVHVGIPHSAAPLPPCAFWPLSGAPERICCMMARG